MAKSLLQMLSLTHINKTWTLFLDRDGVINDEKHMDYVHTWEEFIFFPGVKEAIKIFGEVFGQIFVVTNQRGVGKGVTKLEDLKIIHKNMLREITEAGGRIDAIYFCTDVEETSLNRKPNPGMGLLAKKEFPKVDFSKAIMIGNTLSDMEFGRRLGVKTILLPSDRREINQEDDRIDAIYESLISFAKTLEGNL